MNFRNFKNTHININKIVRLMGKEKEKKNLQDIIVFNVEYFDHYPKHCRVKEKMNK